MPTLKTKEDIKPLSKFRANVRQYLDRVRKSHRPLIVTQYGEAAGVLLDLESYDDYLELADSERLRKEVRLALAEVKQGKVMSYSEFKRKMNKRLNALLKGAK
jgi:prevent-host-death family protein